MQWSKICIVMHLALLRLRGSCRWCLQPLMLCVTPCWDVETRETDVQAQLHSRSPWCLAAQHSTDQHVSAVHDLQLAQVRVLQCVFAVAMKWFSPQHPCQSCRCTASAGV